jgi:uncharacterized membrane protein
VKCPQVQRCDVKEVAVLMAVITVISPVVQQAWPMSSRTHVHGYELPVVIRLMLTVDRTGVNEHLDILCSGITNKCINFYQFIILFSCCYMFRQLCAILRELVCTF